MFLTRINVNVHMGVSINEGTTKWRFTMDNPINMVLRIIWGYPILGNLHIFV